MTGYKGRTWCADCGQTHVDGIGALRCDYQLGGEQRVRNVLARIGVAPIVIDRIVDQLAEEATS